LAFSLRFDLQRADCPGHLHIWNNVYGWRSGVAAAAILWMAVAATCQGTVKRWRKSVGKTDSGARRSKKSTCGIRPDNHFRARHFAFRRVHICDVHRMILDHSKNDTAGTGARVPVLASRKPTNADRVDWQTR
tara:strand:- start:10591 stop:10989 length:399 start_codon:yes stop_codon:yes gene_type:complete